VGLPVFGTLFVVYRVKVSGCKYLVSLLRLLAKFELSLTGSSFSTPCLPFPSASQLRNSIHTTRRTQACGCAALKLHLCSLWTSKGRTEENVVNLDQNFDRKSSLFSLANSVVSTGHSP
jgi:hypothetical protein